MKPICELGLAIGKKERFVFGYPIWNSFSGLKFGVRSREAKFFSEGHNLVMVTDRFHFGRSVAILDGFFKIPDWRDLKAVFKDKTCYFDELGPSVEAPLSGLETPSGGNEGSEAGPEDFDPAACRVARVTPLDIEREFFVLNLQAPNIRILELLVPRRVWLKYAKPCSKNARDHAKKGRGIAFFEADAHEPSIKGESCACFIESSRDYVIEVASRHIVTNVTATCGKRTENVYRLRKLGHPIAVFELPEGEILVGYNKAKMAIVFFFNPKESYSPPGESDTMNKDGYIFKIDAMNEIGQKKSVSVEILV